MFASLVCTSAERTMLSIFFLGSWHPIISRVLYQLVHPVKYVTKHRHQRSELPGVLTGFRQL